MTDEIADNDILSPSPWRSKAPLVVPAKTTYISNKGDSAYAIGDAEQLRKNKDGRWYEKRHYVIPAQRVPFGPLIQDGLVLVPGLKGEDWSKLENLLDKEIPSKDRDRIDAASSLLVNSIVMNKRMAKWADLGKVLKSVGPAAEVLLKQLIELSPSPPQDGVLSPQCTIGTFIAIELDDPPYGLNRLITDLSQLVAFGKRALADTQTGAGTGAQAELRLFLFTVAEIAHDLGAPLSLPGHDNGYDPKDEAPPRERTPTRFFSFMRTLLQLTDTYARSGIDRCALPREEKAAALKTLAEYAGKSELALEKQLARIRKKIESSESEPLSD